MVTRRTSQPADRRLDDTPSVPAGMIPHQRAGSDPETLDVPAGCDPEIPVAPEPPSGPGRRRGFLRIGVPVGAVAALAVGAAALLGHGSSSQPAEGPAPAAAPRSAAELGFLQIVRQQASFAGVPDDSLINVGLALCQQLRAGEPAAELGLGSSVGQYSVEDVSTVVGAAAGAFCPDQMARVAEPG